MINTSEKYKSAIKSDVEQDVFIADFGFMPEGAKEGATLSSNDQASASKLEQINNGVNSMAEKWATCEPNRVILDGEYENILLNNTKQIGYISNAMCDTLGAFSTPASFEYILDNVYDLIGITLFFDDKCEEWAVAGKIEYYDVNDAKLSEYAFENDTFCALIDGTQAGVRKIKVLITKWNTGYRHAKVSGILPGQTFVFDDDNTLSFTLKEDISPFECSITIPEFSIVFDNSDKKFDIINPKGLIAFLKQKMKINAKMGVVTQNGIEYINCGNYFLYDYPQETQEDIAEFVCKPSMAFKTGYYSNEGRGTQTVEQACAIIMAGESYTIDEELKNIVVNQYIGEEVPLINAMGQLAVACGGYWKFNRDNTYQLRKWSIPSSSNEVDYDNMWNKPNIRQNKLVTSCNCKYYQYNSTYKHMESFDNIVSLENNIGEQKDIDSVFIPNAERANEVANFVLEYYSHRLDHEVDFRGDLSIEPGDTAKVENDYAQTDVIITSINVTYTPESKLSEKLEGIS